MLRKRAAGKVQNVRLEVSDTALHRDRFVNIFASPSGFSAIEEPDFPVWVPAAVKNPAADILRKPRHRIGIELRSCFLDLPDFGFERLAQAFVGIERENPIVSGKLGCEVFLGGIAMPEGFNHASAELLGNLRG